MRYIPWWVAVCVVVAGAARAQEVTNGGDFTVKLGTSSANTVERMRVTQGGLVGIGTATPGAMLDVAGSVKATRVGVGLTPLSNVLVSVSNTSTNQTGNAGVFFEQQIVTANGTYYNKGLQAQMRSNISSGVTNGGYMVGLHSETFHTSPGSLQNLYGLWVQYGNYVGGTGTTTNAYGILLTPLRSAGTITNNYGIFIEDVLGTNQWGIYQEGSGDTNYFAGNVGIGTNTPDNALQVVGNVAASGYVGAGCEVDCESTGGYALLYSDGHIQITGDGYKPGGGSWAASSDRRLKRDIVPVTDALDKIVQLRGVTFKWRNPDEHGGPNGGGFVAQEVKKVFPDFVMPQPCRGADCGLVDDGTILTMKLPFTFDAYLVEAIKEQQAEIDALAHTNAAFKDGLESLRAEFAAYKRAHP